MGKKSLSSLFLCVFLIMLTSYVFAQTPPTSQTAGGVTRQEKQIEKSKELEERIEYEIPSEEEVLFDEVLPEDIESEQVAPAHKIL